MEKPRLTMEYGSEYLLGNTFTRAIVISVLDKKYGQEEAVWNTNFSGSASIDIRVGFLSQFYKLLMDLYFIKFHQVTQPCRKCHHTIQERLPYRTKISIHISNST
jgi:hypothetical protein